MIKLRRFGDISIVYGYDKGKHNKKYIFYNDYLILTVEYYAKYNKYSALVGYGHDIVVNVSRTRYDISISNYKTAKLYVINFFIKYLENPDIIDYNSYYCTSEYHCNDLRKYINEN